MPMAVRSHFPSSRRSVCGTDIRLLEIDTFEAASVTDRSARYHENAASAIVNGLGILWRRGNMCFHDFEYEQAVFVDEAGIDQLALEAREALADERCLHL